MWEKIRTPDRIQNKQWTPEGIAAYILELNERVEPLETEMLLKPLGISRTDKHTTRKLETIFKATSPSQISNKTERARYIDLHKKKYTLDRINNFPLQKFIKDYDMNSDMFELFVFRDSKRWTYHIV